MNASRYRIRMNFSQIFVAAILGGLFLFLCDAWTATFVTQTIGSVTAIDSGVRIKTTRCNEVRIVLGDGQSVLARVINDAGQQCQIGDQLLVRHYRTKLLRISSYEALHSNGTVR